MAERILTANVYRFPNAMERELLRREKASGEPMVAILIPASLAKSLAGFADRMGEC